MRRIYPLCLFVLLSCTITSRAQERKTVSPGPYASTDPSYDKLNLGIGFGFDYGGIGGNLTVYPQKNIGLFVGGGYAFAGFGYNAGIKCRLLPAKPSSQFTPFFMAMYGYNAAVHVSNASQYDKMYYGPTFGIGFDLGSHEQGKGQFSLAFFVPIRSTNPNDYIDYLKNTYGITFKNKILPIGFSVGYKFNLD
ncbi:MAG: hypothetical protein BGO55_31195 [Sphingobacteriales bacterium 50-39]|nr:hypothetical protein [Sphingobacteriales bacterium]OJW60979.1 MAG: hypothetical protein BGO55_31195 [Sphingobacteriales bacterium 50-39]